MPSITVVMPTYNGQVFVREAIESVWRQDMLPQEFIVVDDGSTDQTIGIVRKAIRESPCPMRVLSLARNSGSPVQPIDSALERSEGGLVAVLDQDDLFEPHRLSSQAGLLERHPSISFAFGLCGDIANGKCCQPTDYHQDLERYSQSCEDHRVLSGSAALALLLKHGNVAYGFPGFMFRRRDWKARGGLDASFRIAGDLDFLCWLCGRGSVAYLPRVVYRRREHGGNLTQAQALMNFEVARIRSRYFLRHKHALTNKYPFLKDHQPHWIEPLRKGGLVWLALRMQVSSLSSGALNPNTLAGFFRMVPAAAVRNWHYQTLARAKESRLAGHYDRLRKLLCAILGMTRLGRGLMEVSRGFLATSAVKAEARS